MAASIRPSRARLPLIVAVGRHVAWIGHHGLAKQGSAPGRTRPERAGRRRGCSGPGRSMALWPPCRSRSKRRRGKSRLRSNVAMPSASAAAVAAQRPKMPAVRAENQCRPASRRRAGIDRRDDQRRHGGQREVHPMLGDRLHDLRDHAGRGRQDDEEKCPQKAQLRPAPERHGGGQHQRADEDRIRHDFRRAVGQRFAVVEHQRTRPHAQPQVVRDRPALRAEVSATDSRRHKRAAPPRRDDFPFQHRPGGRQGQIQAPAAAGGPRGTSRPGTSDRRAGPSAAPRP